MQTVRIFLILLSCTVLLGACGLKGPLYLPGEDPASVQVPGPDSSAELDAEETQEDTEDSGGSVFYPN
jgi:predicted small lipoprotein YifL